MKKSVFFTVFLWCVIGFSFFFGKHKEQSTMIQDRIQRNKTISINYRVAIDTYIQEKFRDKTKTLPKLHKITTQLTGEVALNINEKKSQGNHTLIVQWTGSEVSLHLQAQLNHIISSGLYVQLNTSMLQQNPISYNELFLMHNFAKSYHHTRIQQSTGFYVDTTKFQSLFWNWQHILQSNPTDEFQYYLSISSTSSSRRSKSYTLSGSYQYLSLFSGNIQGDMILSPKEKEQINAPIQSISWNKIMELLKKH